MIFGEYWGIEIFNIEKIIRILTDFGKNEINKATN